MIPNVNSGVLLGTIKSATTTPRSMATSRNMIVEVFIEFFPFDPPEPKSSLAVKFCPRASQLVRSAI